MELKILADQIERLKRRFGEKNFDAEFIKLIANEVRYMADYDFIKFCDVLIGSRTPNKPPLLSDFREARLAYEKYHLDRITSDSAKILEHPAKGDGLKKILKEQYGNVSNITEAIEYKRLQDQIAKANGKDDGGVA